jgi:hypothetical protein
MYCANENIWFDSVCAKYFSTQYPGYVGLSRWGVKRLGIEAYSYIIQSLGANCTEPHLHYLKYPRGVVLN